jgi:DNA-binding LytR/AlgR family response regulator
MQNFFFIRMDGKYVKINLNEIIYVEGCKNYIKIITDLKSYMVLITMKRMEELLPASLFQRIHKSFIVSLERVIEFNTESVYLKNKELPIGHLYKGAIERVVVIANDTFCRVVRVAMSENNERELSKAI